MRHEKLDLRAALAIAVGVVLTVSCTDDSGSDDDGGMTTVPGSSSITNPTADGGATSADSNGDVVDEDTGEKLDEGVSATGGVPSCVTDSACNLIDVLFVIDNSGTMGEEQLNLAANFPLLVDRLQTLTDAEGNAINPNVNIMVTTTDFGHPLCTTFQAPDYQPRKGAPVYQGCNTRINRFTGLAPSNEDPVVIEEACTQNCPVDIAPGDQFLHFDSQGSNVPNDDVAAALSCIGPQGIDGCGYESPLETMLQALNETACWNSPDQENCESHPEFSLFNQGFLREDAVLAVAIVTDEVDCSVKAPEGFTYFTSPMDSTYWNLNPELKVPQATSAVCWNAGVTCSDENSDGVYEECNSAINPALHDVDRYTDYLDYLVEDRDKEVVMLGILGVPPVTAHNQTAPFEPTAGGVIDLVYRDWINGEYPAGDILPVEWAEGVDVDDKRFDFGTIGPGCTGTDDLGGFTGQAIPPVRIKEVCEHLNGVDDEGNARIRCCIESICDTDFSDAISCLTGIIQTSLVPTG